MDEKVNYSNQNLKKDIDELKLENRIQTIAVVLFFFFGIATLTDIVKK